MDQGGDEGILHAPVPPNCASSPSPSVCGTPLTLLLLPHKATDTELFYDSCTFNYSKINGHNYPIPSPGTYGLAYMGPASPENHDNPGFLQSTASHPSRQLANHETTLQYFYL